MNELTERSVDIVEDVCSRRETLRVLKHDDLFAVFDPGGDFRGDLHAVGPDVGADGLFQDDTRILSKFVLRIQGQSSQLLGSDISSDNVVFTAHLTNRSFDDGQGRPIPHGRIYLRRRRLLWRRRLYETLSVHSFSTEPIDFDLTFDVDSDFRDVFEIRGATRARRGEVLPPCGTNNCLKLAYLGLDGVMRITAVNLSSLVEIRDRRITMPIQLAPRGRTQSTLTVASNGETTSPNRRAFLSSVKASKREARRHIYAFDRVETSNLVFNTWVKRAAADLSLLITELETGPYPYAGIPWFSVPFGRDAVITALQTLWVNPALARGVLAYLAAMQAQELSKFHDSEPGKIVHEIRKGEMAELREVPFSRYYGGVDTTPLFVVLAGAYLDRSNDVEFAGQIWPAVRAAVGWLDDFADADRDGLVEYNRSEAGGLQNQGWKDSDDSIFHSDGSFAKGPIALVEVQAYVVAAKHAAARIASAIGEEALAKKLETEAERLQRDIEFRFWSEALGTYVIALDGDKRPCEVRSSNAGHVLFCGVAEYAKARRVGEDLMGRHMFTGWGIRTIASDALLYNPMSYHNGTVWPHDCSIIAAGLARYGMCRSAGRIFAGLFDAVRSFPNFRLPELFCGFQRKAGQGPVGYPSSCTPQAWASGAVFLLLQASLGLEIDATEARIRVVNPFLPDWLDHVTIRNLSVGSGGATVHFRREESGVAVSLSDVVENIRLERNS